MDSSLWLWLYYIWLKQLYDNYIKFPLHINYFSYSKVVKILVKFPSINSTIFNKTLSWSYSVINSILWLFNFFINSYITTSLPIIYEKFYSFSVLKTLYLFINTCWLLITYYRKLNSTSIIIFKINEIYW